MTRRGDLSVVGLGGNAIIPNANAGTIEEQRTLTRATMAQVAEQIALGVDVVLTHGNGPIIGNIALRNEALAHEVPPMPLDVCGADSQGGIGYMVQQALQNELHRLGVQRPVVTLVTQVEVDPSDPAFRNPTKPIGPFYDLRQAERLRQEKAWVLRDDSGRGLRRLVPSPKPKSIVEMEVIRTLVEEGVIVNCVGGGGVPVVRRGGEWVGVEAVIDKDRTATILATQLRASRIILLTGVETVMRGFRTPSEAPLHRITPEEAEQLLAAGEFPTGSMGPKIEAALDFLNCGGQEVIITDPEHLFAALSGNTGTHITVT
jgi:carbamate kinase